MRDKLEEYLRVRGIKARIIRFEASTRTVEDAEKALGISRKKIIKSMLFVDERGKPTVAIVTGDRGVNTERLAQLIRASRVKLATPSVVRALTGFEVGGLPPIAHERQGEIRYIIDEDVMRLDLAYGGGGDDHSLLEIDPKDVKRLTNAETHKISN
ncbi:MAG: aminoacyl-tRNA deacylase [Candidatus Geothermarchaeales archaeon]